MADNDLKIFTGNATSELAASICDDLGVELGQAEIKSFSDLESSVELQENVRGMDVFVIQSTCSPANETLMELLILLDTVRRASAKRITAVIPYYGYSRQDRKIRPRTPITARLVADLIQASGADRALCLDLHAGQIQGFFSIPVDNLFAMPVLLDQIRSAVPDGEPMVMVSPDAGGVERARAYAKRLNADLAIADKRREQANVSEILHIVGDVKDRTAVIVDDMMDTAGSVTQTAEAVMKQGARRVLAAITHPVLSGPAIRRIVESPLERVVTTDTIPLRSEAESCAKVSVATVSHLLAESIRRIHMEESVSTLFV
jgi:ribose-phosphate pyrophosphokinase